MSFVDAFVYAVALTWLAFFSPAPIFAVTGLERRLFSALSVWEYTFAVISVDQTSYIFDSYMLGFSLHVNLVAYVLRIVYTVTSTLQTYSLAEPVYRSINSTATFYRKQNNFLFHAPS